MVMLERFMDLVFRHFAEVRSVTSIRLGRRKLFVSSRSSMIGFQDGMSPQSYWLGWHAGRLDFMGSVRVSVPKCRGFAFLAFIGVACTTGTGFHGSGVSPNDQIIGASGPAPGPHTRAERTNYRETSTYADVIAFLDSLHGRPELSF